MEPWDISPQRIIVMVIKGVKMRMTLEFTQLSSFYLWKRGPGGVKYFANHHMASEWQGHLLTYRLIPLVFPVSHGILINFVVTF